MNKQATIIIRCDPKIHAAILNTLHSMQGLFSEGLFEVITGDPPAQWTTPSWMGEDKQCELF